MLGVLVQIDICFMCSAGGITSDYLVFDENASQMATLVYSNWFVPSLFLAASIPILFDTVRRRPTITRAYVTVPLQGIFLWKHAHQDEDELRQQKASIYIEKAVQLHGE